jgi:hypothetical protein
MVRFGYLLVGWLAAVLNFGFEIILVVFNMDMIMLSMRRLGVETATKVCMHRGCFANASNLGMVCTAHYW